MARLISKGAGMETDLEQGLLAIVRDGLLGNSDFGIVEEPEVIIASAQLYALLKDIEPIDKAEFRKRRREVHQTQGTLANMLNLHRYTVSRWETGQTQVPKYIIPILDVLKQ